MKAYGVAVMCILPDAHPVHKSSTFLLHNSNQISCNVKPHKLWGIIDNIFSIGGEGKNELVQRSNSLYCVH